MKRLSRSYKRRRSPSQLGSAIGRIGRLVLFFAIVLLELQNASFVFGAKVTADGVQFLTAETFQEWLNKGGTNEFSGDAELVLDSELVVTKNVSIASLGGRIKMRGQQRCRMLHVLPGIRCELSGFSFQDGSGQKGGAILNEGSLHLTDCDFVSNVATGMPFRIVGYFTNLVSEGDSVFRADLKAILDHQAARGGAIANYGSLFATNCVFQENQARGQTPGILRCERPPDWSGGAVCNYERVIIQGEMGLGGAVYNQGTATFSGSSFQLNRAVGGNGSDSPIPEAVGGGVGGQGAGGAIYQESGILRAFGTSLTGNQAQGGDAGYFWDRLEHSEDPVGGMGGAIAIQAGGIELATCRLHTNLARGLRARGGALALEAETAARIHTTDFRSNQATFHGYILSFLSPKELGGGAVHSLGALQMDLCELSDNESWTGPGGGLWTGGRSTLSRMRLTGNRVRGIVEGDYIGHGLGHPGFNTYGGGLFNGSDGTLDLVDSCIDSNVSLGGEGYITLFADNPSFRGGHGLGGGVWTEGILRITNATFASNRAIGGVTSENTSRHFWWPGGGFGGGIAGLGGQLVMNHCTFKENQAIVSNVPPPNYFLPDEQPWITTNINQGSAFFFPTTNQTQVELINTVIGAVLNSSNVYGTLIDRGYNLNADASGFFTHPTSRERLNPRLGVLAHRGGPTPTINLGFESPCLDSAQDETSSSADSRNVARPQGSHPDIGAYEAGGLPELQTARDGQVVSLIAFGTLGRTYVLESSTDLSSWQAASELRLDDQGQQLGFGFKNSGPLRFLRLIEKP